MDTPSALTFGDGTIVLVKMSKDEVGAFKQLVRYYGGLPGPLPESLDAPSLNLGDYSSLEDLCDSLDREGV